MASAKSNRGSKGSSAAAGKAAKTASARHKAPKRETTQRFGSHVSTAGGLETAFERGLAVGCDCIQIFVKNQRQWKAKPLEQEQIQAFKSALKEAGLDPVFAHASYLLNLASPAPENRKLSIDALVDELERCEALGVVGLVIHPGAHMGAGVDAGLEHISQSLDEVHQRAKGFATKILLEITAGQGSALGHEFSHLARIIENVKSPERLAVCLDTCHLFAAGYDFRTDEGYGRMLNDLTGTVGANRISCIHTNDSKADCGSHVDRHEHINQGKIGKAGFDRLLNDARLAQVPRILETEKGPDENGVEFDVVNLKRLRDMVRK